MNRSTLESLITFNNKLTEINESERVKEGKDIKQKIGFDLNRAIKFSQTNIERYRNSDDRKDLS